MKRTREADEETKGESDDESTNYDEDDARSEGAVSSASTDYAYEDDDISGENDAQVEPRRHYVLVGTFEELEDAFAARDQYNGFIYSYDTRYVSATTQGRVFKCVSHAQCGHRLKIKTIFSGLGGEESHELWEGGVHSQGPVRQTTRHGISAAVIRDVDSNIQLGFGASMVRNMLDHKYRGDSTMLKLVPDRRQIENRKAYMKKNLDEAWEITSFATFNAWASTRICRGRDDFNSIVDPSDPRMDDMILLDTFMIPATNDSPASFGVIATSRRLFRNVATCVRDQGDQLVCATDGTYKIHFGGWTLVDCGSQAVMWSRNQHVHRFIPFLYMFARSESTQSYSYMLTILRDKACELLGIVLRVRFGSLDHCEAIAAAFEEVFPGIRLLMCYPHLFRQAKAKKTLLKDAKKYESLIKPHLKLLRSARSHEQFIQLARIVTDEWVTCDERDYAFWFRSVYLTRRWERWHISGAGVAGVIPSQQGIEAHHGVLKKTCLPHTLASTTAVMESILPRVLKADGRDLCPGNAAHLCEGPVPPEMLMKASRLCSKENFCKRFEGRGSNRHVAAIIFNSSRHMVGGGMPNGVPVDTTRAKRFEQSLIGVVEGDTQARELQFELLSLHRVSIAKDADTHPLQLAPVWRFDTISTIRDQMQCTCHAYVRTGWVCSHVLAALSILDRLDLDIALQRLPVRRAPGRPPARSKALQRDDPQEGYFQQRNLVKLFTRKPGTPLNWRIVDDFDVTTNGIAVTAHFVGVVASVRLSDGVYVWSARFDEGDMRDYEVDELAAAMERAHHLGVDVTP